MRARQAELRAERKHLEQQRAEVSTHLDTARRLLQSTREHEATPVRSIFTCRAPAGVVRVIWVVRWSSAEGRRLRAIRYGKRSAEYWRARGCANLVLAREMKRRKRVEQKRLAEQKAEVASELENSRRLLGSTREQS